MFGTRTVFCGIMLNGFFFVKRNFGSKIFIKVYKKVFSKSVYRNSIKRYIKSSIASFHIYLINIFILFFINNYTNKCFNFLFL